MKPMLLQLAAYHLWAGKVLFKKLAAVPEEVLQRELVSSFPGINATLFHLLEAQSVWSQRIQLQEHIVYPDESRRNDYDYLSSGILRYSQTWIDLISEASETRLQHVFEYRNSKREAFKQPLFEVLIHIFNHQTYHFGQIITLLRQQGVERLPATDFIEFSRKKGRV